MAKHERAMSSRQGGVIHERHRRDGNTRRYDGSYARYRRHDNYQTLCTETLAKAKNFLTTQVNNIVNMEVMHGIIF